MTTPDLVGVVIDALNANGVAYMVTGSLASNSYGVPRTTRDADFVLQAHGDEVSSIARALEPTFKLDAQMSFETITMTQKSVLRHNASDFLIELFLLTEDPHDQSHFARRTPGRVLDRSTWLPTAEDVVIQKLRWSRGGRRNKDIDDALNVLAVQHDALDGAYMEWCREHGTLDLLRRLREQIP